MKRSMFITILLLIVENLFNTKWNEEQGAWFF